MKLKHTFTIPRYRWLRGKGSDNSSLLNAAGKQCCVGIYLSSLGMDNEDLLGKPGPEDFDAGVKLPKPARWLLNQHGSNTTHANELFEVNDYGSPKSREADIRELFKRVGVQVRFIGGRKRGK